MSDPSASPGASAGERHPDFPRMLRKTLQDVYDQLGLCVFCSIVWSVCIVFAAAWAFGLAAPTGVGVSFIVGSLLVGPVTMGLYEVAGQVATSEDASAKDLWLGARKHAVRGALLLALNAAFLGAAGLSVWFYTAYLSGAVFKIIGFLWLYVVALWLLSQLFCPAFIVRQGVGVPAAVKRSAVLILDNLGYTFALAVQIGALLLVVYLPVGLMAKPVVPLSFMLFFVVLPAFVAVLAMNAYDDLMRKYD